MSDTTQSVLKKEEKPLEFVPFGGGEAIKLTIDLVKKLIAVPTKSGRTCSDRDAMKFMMLCKAKGLNPWEGDAYLIGYDSNFNGAVIPTYSLITAHQAFLKRAELHPEYDGMKSGLILLSDDGKTTRDVEGDFHLPDDSVAGGWATVFFKTRKNPMQKRLRMARFNKGYGVWKDDAAGMIVKCAEADALRSAFPTKMGGLYLREEFEMPQVTVSPSHEIPASALVDVTPQQQSDPDPAAKEEQPFRPLTGPVQELEALVTSNGFTFSQLQKWGLETENIKEADSMAGFDDVPVAIAKRLLNAKAGLLKGLAANKEQVSK